MICEFGLSYIIVNAPMLHSCLSGMNQMEAELAFLQLADKCPFVRPTSPPSFLPATTSCNTSGGRQSCQVDTQIRLPVFPFLVETRTACALSIRLQSFLGQHSPPATFAPDRLRRQPRGHSCLHRKGIGYNNSCQEPVTETHCSFNMHIVHLIALDHVDFEIIRPIISSRLSSGTAFHLQQRHRWPFSASSSPAILLSPDAEMSLP
ncbi:unnamed protein product [Protopolystoma xenopodis]|uniref:Uncharacterized protein n=1 Tax=Protopolystoma xenopodis TaxID=117903 RepID=A0A448XE89_9PLAT|nr:unnamed protein product [Protopolystoma xenopodis]